MEENELRQKKEKIFQFIQEPAYKPMKPKEMAELLMVPKEERENFSEVILTLAEEGKITFSETGKIMQLEGTTRVGTFLATRRGFGFVEIEGESDDIFIPACKCKDAFHGDTVLVQLWHHGEKRSGKAREGAVFKVLKRNTTEVVGTYCKQKNFGFVIVDNEKIDKDIYIPKGKSAGAVEGHKVVVELTDYGNETKNPEGEVKEILGHVNDPGVDILSVIRSFGLAESFPEDVMKSLKQIPDEVDEEEVKRRKDLRIIPTITIDGADAKDLDDAVTLEQDADGIYHLGVHIADVSQYVQENSPLDREALKRGTSVYLVDRVIPMLPHKLSNGICSLNAGVDRLALSCLMDIDETGKIIGHEIAETVIRVDYRMTYTDVNDIIAKHKKETCEKYSDFVSLFERMAELASKLRKLRKKKGSINFDFPECKIYLDEKGVPTEILPYEHNAATRLIEEFMLAANQTVAEEYFWMEIPFLYRTHEYPDIDKIRELAALTRGFGYHLKVGSEEIHPRELQKLIEQISGTQEDAFLSRLILRSMKRASYTVENVGHFGLAMKYYSHFTSPIRRYPDLQIHRIIKENLHNKMNESQKNHYAKILPGVARNSSDMERRADEAEREVDKMKKAQYMENHIGEVFEGVISGVTSWGLYVELENTVEGMVRISDIMNDTYQYDESNYQIIGRYSGKILRLGERTKVQVIRVDRLDHTVDFMLWQNGEDEDVKRRKKDDC